MTMPTSDFLVEIKRRMGVTENAATCGNCKHFDCSNVNKPPQCTANAVFHFMVQYDWSCNMQRPKEQEPTE